MESGPTWATQWKKMLHFLGKNIYLFQKIFYICPKEGLISSNETISHSCLKINIINSNKNFCYFSQKNCFWKAIHLRRAWQRFWIHPSLFYVLAKLNRSFMMCLTGFSKYASVNKNLLLKRVCQHCHITLKYVGFKYLTRSMIYLKRSNSNSFHTAIHLFEKNEKIFTADVQKKVKYEPIIFILLKTNYVWFNLFQANVHR